MRTRGRWVVTLAAVALGLAGRPVAGMSASGPAWQLALAQGTDVKAEIKTAVTHAGFAAGGTTMSYVQQHLGHALNCLEGTKGKNFNQSWGHVCQGMGNGIVEDLRTTTGGTDFLLVAQQADALAVAGLSSKNLNEAKMAAKGVAALLTVIADNLK
jgi:hypothetical protein